jgi:hypothetical protein
MVYLMETNVNVYSWLVAFYKSNPIPKVNNPRQELAGSVQNFTCPLCCTVLKGRQHAGLPQRGSWIA